MEYVYHACNDNERVVTRDMILPSGVSSVDLIFKGGLHTGRFTHLFGEAGSGKTTLALQFVFAAYKLGHLSVYVNSDSATPIERLEQVAEKSFDKMESLVTLVAPKTFEEQGTLIDDLELYAREGTRLVVIDTLTRLYRTVLEGRKENYSAHRELNNQSGILKGLAREYDMAVLVLNQVRGKMDSMVGFEPVAKNIMEYWSDYSMRLRSGKTTGERVLDRLHPEGEPSQRRLYITQRGLKAERDNEKSEIHH